MCCLFGILDYGNTLTVRQRTKVLSILSASCEVRGTDATGISFNLGDRLCVYKRPLPAHKMHFHVPSGVHYVMGHTRMTTQGNEKKNYNNHPFVGRVGNVDFALAHNGVLYNDDELHRTEKLPVTKIETDSYVAVQLIEKYGTLDFKALKYTAELLEGSFVLTVMDKDNNLYFVKGDNPMCIYHFKEIGVYVYASTEEILKTALYRFPYNLGRYEKVNVESGTILKIDKYGKQSKADFKFTYPMRYYAPYSLWDDISYRRKPREKDYVRELKSVATSFGVSPEDIDLLLAEGFTTDDIEEYLYCGQY